VSSRQRFAPIRHAEYRRRASVREELTVPAFSVVICTYNRPALVARAIRSVLRQTFGDFELVVVDGSPDGETRAVVATFDDARLRYVNEDAAGICEARNTGVASASGQFVVFLDDDDEATTCWLETFHARIAGDERAVVTCGAAVTDEHDRHRETLLPRPLGPAFEDLTGLFRSGTFAVSRDDYWAAGGFADGLQCSHQTEFALRLLPLCKERGSPVRAINEPLVRYVLRDSDQRPASTPLKVLSGAKFVLARHETRLARSPALLADWLATAGVAAARIGDYREARRLFGRATRVQPWRAKHAARFVLGCVPPLGDLVWKARRYRRKSAVSAANGVPA